MVALVRKTGFLIIAVFLLLFVVVSFASGLFSVAKVVNELGDLSSVESAFLDCNRDRATFLSDGLDCEPCALVASSGKTVLQDDGLYSFSYNPDSRIYRGDFVDLSVDYIGGVRTPVSVHVSDNPGFYSSSLLEVKSFCHDSIRVCTVQGDVATVEDVILVVGGEIRKLRVPYGFNDCTSDKIQSIEGFDVWYQVVCDDGFYVFGDKIDKNIALIGECRPIEEPSGDLLGGSLVSVVVSDIVETNSEVKVRGSFEVEASGTYLVSASRESEAFSQGLSVVTGFSASDPCGRGLDSAGKFVQAVAGDVIVFDLSLQAPNTPGIYTYIVEVVDSCEGFNSFDSGLFSVEVVRSETLKELVIENVVTSEPDFYDEFVKGLVAATEETVSIGDNVCVVDGSAVFVGEDIFVEGCSIATCGDGPAIVYNDEVVCLDSGDVLSGDAVKQSGVVFKTSQLKSFDVRRGGLAPFVIVGFLLLGVIAFLLFRRGGSRK